MFFRADIQIFPFDLQILQTNQVTCTPDFFVMSYKNYINNQDHITSILSEQIDN